MTCSQVFQGGELQAMGQAAQTTCLCYTYGLHKIANHERTS